MFEGKNEKFIITSVSTMATATRYPHYPSGLLHSGHDDNPEQHDVSGISHHLGVEVVHAAHHVEHAVGIALVGGDAGDVVEGQCEHVVETLAEQHDISQQSAEAHTDIEECCAV